MGKRPVFETRKTFDPRTFRMVESLVQVGDAPEPAETPVESTPESTPKSDQATAPEAKVEDKKPKRIRKPRVRRNKKQKPSD